MEGELEGSGRFRGMDRERGRCSGKGRWKGKVVDKWKGKKGEVEGLVKRIGKGEV